MDDNVHSTSYDVFISYASEERAEIAQPLAELLKGLGLVVWFDQFELKVGDGLRRKIDEGLAKSRYGVVLLSKNFFAKDWTNRELDGLAQREVGREKVILPVYCDVDNGDVRAYSPVLADRIASRWQDGLAVVATQILETVRPDLFRQLETQYRRVPRIRTGEALCSVLVGADIGINHNDSPGAEELDLVSDFIQEVTEWSEIWSDMDAGGQIRAVYHINELVQDIESAGWAIYGLKEKRRMKVAGIVDDWVCAILAVTRGEPEHVYCNNKKIFIIRKNEGISSYSL